MQRFVETICPTADVQWGSHPPKMVVLIGFLGVFLNIFGYRAN
jgi:hypothetical protein